MKGKKAKKQIRKPKAKPRKEEAFAPEKVKAGDTAVRRAPGLPTRLAV